MWSWARNMALFPKVQAAVLAADQLCTRIKGKVVNATAESQIVEFSVTVNADHDNPNPICAIVILAILDGEVSNDASGFGQMVGVDLSCCHQSFQKDIRNPPKDRPLELGFVFAWIRGQHASSWLFGYHQNNVVTRMLQQLSDDKDSTGTSLFLRMHKNERNTEVFELGIEFILDVYRGPLSWSRGYYKRSLTI
ncbi:uncharacterized protein BJ212DRAFT_1346887 [Suillus subaureus]|uniref:Uncharacterized protein n=1 Tax=Suillus subaureus TaxID=48587 RepID=A0A9P7EE22_9AGAM|nr:uncharacterized protein BJ212DRAFT_1346887 [Suillus subaureus]KAG1818679.1 hypothetical protein BJ212DRAFT_1346887 [Suillus subaureus]